MDKSRVILTVKRWTLSVRGKTFTVSNTDVAISPKSYSNIVEALEYFITKIKKV